MYEIDSEEGPYVSRQGVRRRQFRPPPADQGRLFPGAAGRQPGRSARRDALGDGRYGAQGRKAPSRGGARAGRAGLSSFRPLVKTADHMQIYKYVVQNVAQQYGKTATFMPKPIMGDNGSGMHIHQSVWKGEQAAVRRQPLCRSVGNRALLHRRHHQARQGDQRLHQPDHQQLQAPDPRLRGAGAAGLFRRATARPRAASPMSRAPRPSASRCAIPTPPPTPIWPLPRC